MGCKLAFLNFAINEFGLLFTEIWIPIKATFQSKILTCKQVAGYTMNPTRTHFTDSDSYCDILQFWVLYLFLPLRVCAQSHFQQLDNATTNLEKTPNLYLKLFILEKLSLPIDGK